jgi:diguanylate cyclase (GGDEF)-like protein/PAS domain S-box-containing protein
MATKTKSVSKPDKKNQSQKDDLSNISEERYRTILDEMDNGYFEVDLAGNYTFNNDTNCRQLGYSKEEMLGSNFRIGMDKESIELVSDAFKNIYITGKPQRSISYKAMRKDGTIRFAEISGFPMKNKKGEIIGFRGMALDITERNQVESQMEATLKALRQSEEKHRSIIENMQEPYWETDLEGNLTFVNDALCKYIGYSKEELIGKKIYRETKEAAKKSFETFNRIYRTGEPIRGFEDTYTRKDGIKGFAELSVSLIRDAEGKPIGFRCFSHDITERKQTEEELRASEARYRSILEDIDEGYFEGDLSGKLTLVNDAHARNLQYSKEDLIGMDFQQFCDEKTAQRMLELYIQVAQTGKPFKGFEAEFYAKDGTKRIVEFSGSLRRDQEGKVIGSRGISRDVTERKQVESQREAALNALRQSEEKYRHIIENLQEPYYEIDLEGNFNFVNEAMCKYTGFSREELIGKKLERDKADKEIGKRVSQAYNRIYETGEPIKGIEDVYTRKDGIKGFAELSVSLIRNEEGKPIGFRGTSHDVTERKQAESQREAMLETIRQSEERYRTIIEQMEEGYFETDLPGKFTFLNDAECRNMGYSREELIGMDRHQYADEKNAKALVKLFIAVYKTGMPVKAYDLELIKKDGTKAVHEISASLIRNSKGEPTGFSGIARDVTERKNAEERIQYLATHDSLTELPNRLMFSQLLNHAIQSAKRNKRQLAVFFIDLDRFKIINDTMGHDAGDQLLQEIARRFKQTLRAVDVVGRLGGDEFVILIEEVKELSHAAIVAHKLLTTVIKPIVLLGEECRVTASIGISIYPQDGENEQTLMKNADSAMYFAKEEGKNNYQFYSKDIQLKSIERLSIETNLRGALERKEFSLHYQAKLDFKTGAITGVEALLRWQSPSLGSVTPTQFIPVAEETGLIVPIGRWVLKTACAQNVAWQRQGLPPVCMAVNLSLRQLTDNNLLEDIETALKDSGMAPNLLELEITESMIMHNPAQLIAVLINIKKIGVRLALDDFGTGYSSLARVKHFPIDTLKVDRSIIHNLQQDPENRDITEAIIAMGKTLSLTVVAEGVETQAQEDFLREHICDEMQGFYFSKPITPGQFGDLLRNHDPASQK